MTPPAGIFERRRLMLGSGVAAALGVALVALAGLLDVERAMHAWLTAYAYGLSLALGALALVMIGWVTGARWFVAVRRPAEAVAATLPLFLLLVLPLLVWMEALYPWAREAWELPEKMASELVKKEAYLDETFFVIRSFAYLLVWSGMAWLLWGWSTRDDRRAPDRQGDDAPRAGGDSRHRAVVLSAVGLPLYGFTVTFASFDWLMSLHPTWHSTIFGIYFFAGAFLGALALLVLLVRGLETRGDLRERVAASHYYALGRLLLTFVVFWAYIAYSQGFLIWIGDLPHEVEFYLARWEGQWKWALILLMVGHFVVPFFLLLSRELKRSPTALSAVAAWILAVHWVDLYWLVAPAQAGRDAWPGWEQPAALLAVTGLMGLFGGWRVRGHPPVPLGDPRLEEAMAYESR